MKPIVSRRSDITRLTTLAISVSRTTLIFNPDQDGLRVAKHNKRKVIHISKHIILKINLFGIPVHDSSSRRTAFDLKIISSLSL